MNFKYQNAALYGQPAHQQLGLSILAAYTGHVIAARLFGVYIGHKAKVTP